VVIVVASCCRLRGDLDHDGALAPADATIALQITASGGWDADADVRDDGCATLPGRAQDPASNKPTHRIMTERTRLKEHEKN